MASLPEGMHLVGLAASDEYARDNNSDNSTDMRIGGRQSEINNAEMYECSTSHVQSRGHTLHYHLFDADSGRAMQRLISCRKTASGRRSSRSGTSGSKLSLPLLYLRVEACNVLAIRLPEKLKSVWSVLPNARGGLRPTTQDRRSFNTSKTLRMWRLPTIDSRISGLGRPAPSPCRRS
jgi:hypothetical protein